MKKKKKNIETIIFLIAFIISLILGIIITYNYDFKNSFNLLFDSDTSRVISDATEITANHYRLNVHPLYTLFVQPVILVISGITQNKIISLIIFSSIVTALSTLYIYKTLSIYSNNNRLKTIITASYFFTFSNLVFTSGIEIYNVAALFLIILWYYAFKKINDNNITFYSSIIFIILGLLSISFTITNYMIFVIILFVLLIFKKINIKRTLLLLIIPLIMLITLNCFQKFIWHTTPLIFESNLKSEKESYSEKTSLKNSISNVIKNDYSNSILSSNLKVKVSRSIKYDGYNYKLEFKKNTIINIVFIILFYVILTLLLIHNFTKNNVENIGIILALLFNSTLHIIYGNNCTFLYSMHFVYLIYLLLGINLLRENNKKNIKMCNCFFITFLIIQIINNSYIFYIMFTKIKEILNPTYFTAAIGIFKAFSIEMLLLAIVVLSLFIMKKIYKTLKKEKNNEKKIVLKSAILFLFLIIVSIFISIEASANLNAILWKNINPGDRVTTIPPDKTYYLDSKFKNYFKKEITSLSNYIDEYNEFLNKYNPNTVDNLNPSDYYYFGFGNRRKLMFDDNSLIDIETGKSIYKFDIEDKLLIPNEYMVIIETKNHEYIKIYEDNYGVHYNSNQKDKIIDGTDVYIELYDFDNQKYKNIKRTLYGEILFNIKDNIIYPNILVYDHPWYRDAAITTMVLKQTNNTNLIEGWINNINEIYDKQNKGISEADNLGELLYIISSQPSINYELVEKIQNEAEKIANNNPNGYYIYGKTDFQDLYLYQNLWYKLGIESLNLDFDFEIDELYDSYSKMAWWSDISMDKFEYDANTLFPYLTTGYRHKNGQGTLVANRQLYPLSWEQNASEANYNSKKLNSNFFRENKISPLHTWAASEMILFLLDETGDLK